ncbi:isopentenyl-diphosphate Delta-isomerase [Yinghuangia seranimata]|uniref:isopentenyl-diphosphate Delta-isomerase n=1 Tax=Yinghuangia seranimata TaxID=408067 RepID=UPI00248C0068|nr:isopentenyl-diphosphate Delta-isomerase [Yinghuangia seranimata]MDI2126043.1 isopentenyl-diphosphate Delta-isomerase [Yinghuangia seranimata]
MTQAASPDVVMVELVDADGNTIGVAEKLAAHQPPGQLHRAFSVFLLGEADGPDAGSVLMQRRALTKYHSPGVWSNTCCSHPYPGEPPADAVARRVGEELGVKPSVLRPAGQVTYDVTDDVSGLVEKEYNHLFVGRVGSALALNPDEVGEVAYVPLGELDAWLAERTHSAWLGAVLGTARAALEELAQER